MSEIGKYFATRLKAARGLHSQADFAQHLGIVHQSYSRYERGSVPDGEVLLKIASKLGTTIELLLQPSDALLKEDSVHYHIDANQAAFDQAMQDLRGIRAALDELELKLKRVKL